MPQAASRLKQLREKQLNKVNEARSILDGVADDATPEARADAERRHDAIMDEVDKIMAEVTREERLADAEARSNPRDPRRPSGEDRSIEPTNEDKAETRKKAFNAYLRYGAGELSPEEKDALGVFRRLDPDKGEQRAMGVSDSTSGGYTVPQGFQDELVVSLKAYGPMLDPGITREIVTTSGNLLPWPSMDDTANKGRRIAENTTVNTTALAFGVKNLMAWKYTTDVVPVASELLQDSALDIEQVIRDAMAIRLGRIVNEEMTTGTGGTMPDGIAHAAPSGYTAASATAISFDDMIELEHSLDPLYRKMPGVRWQFADSTLKALRKLKDGDGQYIWQPASVVAKAPATIQGYSYEVNQAMAAIATGKRSVVFGDHNRYVVRRVREFLVRRLNERYADNDQVGFIGFARYDGALVDSKAIVGLDHP